MYPVIYLLAAFILLGAVGMAIANRKADKKTGRQRWIKYFSYLIITGVIIGSFFTKLFPSVAIIILGFGYAELSRAFFRRNEHRIQTIVLVYSGYSLIGPGFLAFAFIFKPDFQFYLYLQVIIFDAFCQITGQLFGKTQLVPAISPAKTVEGLAGGSVLCILTAYLAAAWMGLNELPAAICGLITAITALGGDLLASSVKRKAGIKDYSGWLPGQGGFLDRFDSFLMTGFVYYLLGATILKDFLLKFLN